MRRTLTLVLVAACGEGDPAMVGTTDTGSQTSSSSGVASSSSSVADTSSSSDSSSESSAGTSGVASSSESGSTGEPPLACGSATLLGCERGMYLSLYTDHAGQNVFGGETEEHRYILGDADKEQLVLDFIAAHRIESLALYDLSTILDDPALRDALESFMTRARVVGVRRIEAIGATSNATWDAIAAFHDEHAPFDGFVTEIEFWNGDVTFEAFLDAIGYARGLPIVAPDGAPPTVSVYLGWVEQAEVDAMLPLVDRAYLHAYVDDAADAFGYAEERIAMFADANDAQALAVEVRPIFSAEDHLWSAGTETFMGEWLADNGIDAAELAVQTTFEASPLHGRIVLGGHQLFSYFYLERYAP